jgi:hypothetical protein
MEVFYFFKSLVQSEFTYERSLFSKKKEKEKVLYRVSFAYERSLSSKVLYMVSSTL